MSPAALKMEDVKPFSSMSNSHSDDDNSMIARFAELCKRMIALGSHIYTGYEVVRRKQAPSVCEHIGYWRRNAGRNRTLLGLHSFCTLKRLSEEKAGKVKQGSDENGFTLCQILRVANVNVVDFLKELSQFFLKVGPILSNHYGTDWEKRLEAKELQANFEQLSLLSKHYNRAFREFFLTRETNNYKWPAVASSTSFVSDYHRFGWFLFLALRIHSFSRFKDLVTCTNGLVSILVLMLLIFGAVRKSSKGVDLLASLCNIYDTLVDVLREIMHKANSLIVDILKKKPCLASECKTENLDNIDTNGLTYFEDLMEESSLSSSLIILEKDYDDAIHNNGELDERMFVNAENSLLGTGSLSGGSMNICGTKRKIDAIASPARSIMSPFSSPCSPSVSPANGSLVGVNSKMVPTPVSTAMTTANWLRTVISPLSSIPSAGLERFLSSCDKNVTNDVIRRAHIILEAIFPSSATGGQCVAGSLQTVNLMDSIWAEQRRMEALKLYYRVLEAMCAAEAQILHASNLTSLLTNERFHSCLFACSAELVLSTLKTGTMLFPVVLDRTGITAFDLSKVIESFIRHEESLPRELRQHLNSLEERLLESMVWEKGSSLYNSLTIARPALSAEIARMGLFAEPMPSLDAIAMHNNISCGGLPPLPSFQKHETSSGQKGDIRSPKRVCSNYQNVLVERSSFTSPVKEHLLAFNSLKSKLPPPLQSAFASPSRPNPRGGGETYAETGINVFFGKISQLNLTFRKIIANYMKQPQCKPQVLSGVFVDWSSARHSGKTAQEYVDIIPFYNEVFIPDVKPLLEELGPAGAIPNTNCVPEVNNNADGQCPGSPRLSPFPNLPDMSPKKVSAAHNVYVSPLRSSKMDALVSHSSKSYYACVGESTRAYQSPSKDLTAINNHLNGTRKLRGALNFDVDNVGLVSDSFVMGNLYLKDGSSASSPGASSLEI